MRTQSMRSYSDRRKLQRQGRRVDKGDDLGSRTKVS